MNTPWRYSCALRTGLVLGVLLSLGVLGARGEAGSMPLQGLRAFAEIFTRIKNDYVEPVADQTLLTSAIRGMLSALDPHSAYLTPEEYGQLEVGMTGEFGGLGIEIGPQEGFIEVISPIDDTPAARAGVKAGDLITRLDNRPVSDMSLNEVIKLMRGEPGTEITLTILRETAPGPFEITITRAVIKFPSIKSRILEPGYGYLRVTRFQSHTGEDLRAAVAKLEAQDGGTLRGVVLDLRNNPGGVLREAVAVADTFLEGGVIVYTEGRVQDARKTFRARPADILQGVPLVVLVNGATASAAEIVAGALKDHRRAVIMGSKTFGKGSVQSILPMGNGAALKLTTARYFTPSGTSIQAVGIVPDIVLEGIEIARVEPPGGRSTQESDLRGHLEGDAVEEAIQESADGADTNGDAAEKRPLAEMDFPIHEALNLLKAFSTLREPGL